MVFLNDDVLVYKGWPSISQTAGGIFTGGVFGLFRCTYHTPWKTEVGQMRCE